MDRPNVLLITADHWPASHLGCAGHPALLTPTLDQLARCGVRYTNAYSECPVCIPARRTLMTGTTPRTHGDRTFKTLEPMPDLPTLAQAFRGAGYQAFAVGKLHVYPQRNRIGFDDVLLAEEGRAQFGVLDDYDLFLGDRGLPGQGFAHGMSNNDYAFRPWHLDEALHVTHWITSQMCRTIRRRDPTRPGFWHLSYTHPHPPLVPLAAYLDLYRDIEPPPVECGDWVEGSAPYALRAVRDKWSNPPAQIAAIRRAFYAQCTHIDHQLRLVVGTLREEGVLDRTILLFTADHGDMLGTHGLWAKRLFYEDSAAVPMLLVGAAGDPRVPSGKTDERLVGWQDIMPTLLDLAGVPVPSSVEGLSMAGARKREHLYGEVGEGPMATRMLHDGRYKLVYYGVGNCAQLFDLREDPRELRDLSGSPAHAAVLERLKALLVAELYGADQAWAPEGNLAGLPDQEYQPRPDRGLSGQRGVHWPPPPHDPSGGIVGAPG